MENLDELIVAFELFEGFEVIEAEVQDLLKVDGVVLGELVVDEETTVVAQEVKHADQAAPFLIGKQGIYFTGDQTQQVVAGEPGLPAVGVEVVLNEPADVVGLNQLPIFPQEIGEL